jgi:hypothetical protein
MFLGHCRRQFGFIHQKLSRYFESLEAQIRLQICTSWPIFYTSEKEAKDINIMLSSLVFAVEVD